MTMLLIMWQIESHDTVGFTHVFYHVRQAYSGRSDLTHERRKSDRYCFNLALHPDGELLLLMDNAEWTIWKLVDISPFGICLSMGVRLNTGSQIALRYRLEENEITVFGTVAWSSEETSNEDGAGFRLGIDFDRDKMALNASLFTALTR